MQASSLRVVLYLVLIIIISIATSSGKVSAGEYVNAGAQYGREGFRLDDQRTRSLGYLSDGLEWSRLFPAIVKNTVAGTDTHFTTGLGFQGTGGETIWVEDTTPAGATLETTADVWNWVSANPAPYTGTLAHQSIIEAGLHQHYFYSATATLPVNSGDILFAYVYLDPANMPSEIMLQWNNNCANGGTDCWRRAYWGADLIDFGIPGLQRSYVGPLPAAGGWVRLEVPASAVGLEGSTLNGMAFTLYGGRATWDRAGKSSIVNGAAFISQSVPLETVAGRSYNVSVTMRNTGTSTWTATNQYKLGSQNEQDNQRWGFNRVVVPTDVPPGAEVTLSYIVNAPPTAGTHNFQWGMLQEGAQWFGEYTANIPVNVKAAAYGEVLISEFRLRGVGGAFDEFIELYNNTNSAITVDTADGSAGWTLAALLPNGITAVPVFLIPNGTVIPARGHYLAVNKAYSLSSFAIGDLTYSTDIADHSGIALFRTANETNFTLGYRINAVGFTPISNELYREGYSGPRNLDNQTRDVKVDS